MGFRNMQEKLDKVLFKCQQTTGVSVLFYYFCDLYGNHKTT